MYICIYMYMYFFSSNTKLLYSVVLSNIIGNNYSYNSYLLYMYMYVYTNLLTLHVAIHVHVHVQCRFTKEHKYTCTCTSNLNIPSLGIGRKERSNCDRYFRKGSSYPQIISSTLRVMNRFSENSFFNALSNPFMISSTSSFAISGRFSTIFCNFSNWTRRP